MDRYTKFLLTVIASALVYLCIVLTPLPGLHAQTAPRPGDPTGPGQVVIVGWQTNTPVPVAFGRPVPVTSAEPLRITGSVTTERSSGAADRVVLVGWEERASRANRSEPMQMLSNNPNNLQALPVAVLKP
jgi:hypothetical protein